MLGQSKGQKSTIQTALALNPVSIAHSALPSPLFKGWDKPVAPRVPEATKSEYGAILFRSSCFLHSLLDDTPTLGGLLSSGGWEREDGSRTRGSPGIENVNSNGGTRKGRMQTQNHWSHDSTLVLASDTFWVALSQHPSLCMRNYSLPMKHRGSADLCLVNTFTQDFQWHNSMLHSVFLQAAKSLH